MSYCTVCQNNTEEVELFFISKRGTPKFICKECEALYDTATKERDPDKAEEALNKLYAYAKHNRDLSVLEMLSDTLGAANRRIAAIRDGSYDFALDEEDEDPNALQEVPEELRQDPEEAREEAEAEEAAKKPSVFDKALNIFWALLGVGALGFILYKIISLFF